MKKATSFVVPLVLALTIVFSFFINDSVLAIDSMPVITAFSPGEGASVATQTPTISFTVSDPDLLSDTGYEIKFNGAALNTNFQYQGHWEYDSCGGSDYWVIDRYDIAIISAVASDAKDANIVEVKALDKLGNVVTKTWGFNYPAKPVVSQMIPANGSIVKGDTSISAIVKDNTQVDASTINLTVDGAQVDQFSYDPISGKVSYTPASPFADGIHTVGLMAADTSGNSVLSTWSFTAKSTGSELTFADADKTLTSSNPYITVSAKSTISLQSQNFTITVDGNSIGASFNYLGHEEYDSCSGETYYVIDSYNEGTLRGTATRLKDGNHTLSVTFRDSLGNSTTKQWNFVVEEKPIFSNMVPVSNAITDNNTAVSVKVTDNDQVNPASIEMFVGDAKVTHSFDAATGLITYNASEPFTDGQKTVSVTAGDMAGNIQTSSWSYKIVTKINMTFTNSGQTLTNATPKLDVALISGVGLDSNGASMVLDGTPLISTFGYKIGSNQEATISGQAPLLKDGSHILVATAKDINGNTETVQWEFQVAVKPVINEFNPGANSLTNNNSNISAKLTDNDKVNPASIKMTVDNNDVQPNFDEATGKVTHTFAIPLVDGNHTINITASDLAGNQASANWNYTVYTKPLTLVFSDNAATLTNASPVLNVTAASNLKLDDKNYSASIDGIPVTATFSYKGHWETDSCSGDTYYVVDSYNEGSISYQTNRLKDGSHNLSVTMKDTIGNVSNSQWQFNVQEKPTISNISPAKNSVTSNYNSISFKISDNDQIDSSTIYMTVDGNIVEYSYDSLTGVITYNAINPLIDGMHTVNFRVKDISGNELVDSWSYTVAESLFLTFTDEGKTINLDSPVLNVLAQSSVGIDSSNTSMTLDGQPLAVTFTYKSGTTLEGTISGKPAALNDGNHTLIVSAKDINGKITSKQFSFTVAVKPTFSNFYPAMNSLSNDNKKVEVKVNDNGTIDPISILMFVDGNPVPSTFNQTTGVITYDDSLAQTKILTNGVHSINVIAGDTFGNTATTSWSYTIQTAGPELIFADSGKTFEMDSPTLSFNAKSNVKLSSDSVSLILDGTPITPVFNYKGYWYYDSCSGDSYYVVESYNEGTITSNTSKLNDGTHNITLTMKDELGNTTTTQWTIKVAVKPVYTNQVPANNGATAENTPIISVKVTDNDAVDPNSVKMIVDQVEVNDAVFDQATGVISYQYVTPLPDGTHKVTVTATDKSGNYAITIWSFVVRTTGPGLTFDKAGQSYNSYKPTLSIAVKSTVKVLDTGYTVLVDGQPATATFAYSNGNIEGIITSSSTALADGTHDLSVTASDIIGNTSTSTWSFTVAQPPVFADIYPANNSIVKTTTPTIKASINDPNGPTIDMSTVSLMVDNRPVTPAISETSGIINVTYISDVFVDGTSHTVSLTAIDSLGNKGVTTWKFEVNTKTPMDLNAQACGTCHTLNSYSKFQHTRFWGDCDHCHANYEPTYCGYCHEPASMPNKYCTDCHTPSYMQHRGITDMAKVHEVQKADCISCHSPDLTKEHNKVNKEGITLTCATCHKSNNPAVQLAVSTKNKDCSACHGVVNHDLPHGSGLDSNCRQCHNEALNLEHIGNQTTAGKNYSCATCHSNSTDNIKRTINGDNLNCSGCHSNGHGVDFADSVPEDIPLYGGFEWTVPIGASVINGMPTGYEKGLIVMSNRRADVTNLEIREYYFSQLANKGWILKNDLSNTQTNYLNAEFYKPGHYLTVKTFATANNNGQGEPIAAGYKIEIWYK